MTISRIGWLPPWILWSTQQLDDIRGHCITKLNYTLLWANHTRPPYHCIVWPWIIEKVFHYTHVVSSRKYHESVVHEPGVFMTSTLTTGHQTFPETLKCSKQKFQRIKGDFWDFMGDQGWPYPSISTQLMPVTGGSSHICQRHGRLFFKKKQRILHPASCG